jgi:hypothetical protein
MKRLKVLDAAAVEKIFARVRETPGGANLDIGAIDRKALRDDLDWEVVAQLTATELGSVKLRKERARRLKQIQATARKLSHLLRVDAADHNVVRSFYSPTDPDPRRVVVRIALAVRRAKKFPPPEPAWLTREATQYIEAYNARSLVDHLVGRIAVVFEKHFHRKPGYTTSDDGTDGPFLRFTEEVLLEYGITNRGQPYALSTLAAALRNARKDKKRRKRSTPRDKT